MKKFEVGQKYRLTFIGDSELHVCYEVTKRTEKTVTVTDGTETKSCRVKPGYMGDAEYVQPMGRYSMSPILSADRIETDRAVGSFRTGMGI